MVRPNGIRSLSSAAVMVLTDSMKFRHAFISLGVSHVVAMALSYPPSAKVASANNVVYNPCGRKEFAHEHSPPDNKEHYQCLQSVISHQGFGTSIQFTPRS